MVNPPPPSSSAPVRPETTLPWDEQAERAVLGAILLDPAALDSALEVIRPPDFRREAHRRILEAMVALAARSEPIDPITLRSELDRLGHLEKIGGTAFVASLIDGLPRVGNAGAYARIVLDRSLLRQALQIAERLRDEAVSARRPAPEILEEVQEALYRLGDAGRRGGFVPSREIAREALAILHERAERRDFFTGVVTGYHALDSKTAGLQKGDLIILAARPSMGKTALALNIAQFAAVSGGHTVGIFSLEMSRQQLFMRLLAGEARVDLQRVRTGRLQDEEWDRLRTAFETLAGARIFIDDTPAITPIELRSKARRLAAEQKLDLLVVDYLQLMRPDANATNRQEEISQISASLKAVAKELGVPVLALSQLSRAPEQRQGDHRPQLSDLRESGAIEQDADLVMFIFRPEVYEKDPDKVEQKGLEGLADLIVAKQRNGPTGVVPLYFVKQFTRFENRSDEPS